MIKFSPSLLAADFTKLGEEITHAEQNGAEYIHFDVMDGVFVPNISFGLPVLSSIRKSVKGVLDVHLMITDPGAYAERFAEAGADIITFHYEAVSPDEISSVIQKIKACGVKAAVSLKPNTPAEVIYPYLNDLDMVLVMTVEPGFGGQKYMESMAEKINAIRKEAERIGKDLDIQVDGGINKNTIAHAYQAGANVFVVGTAFFCAEDPAAVIKELTALCKDTVSA